MSRLNHLDRLGVGLVFHFGVRYRCVKYWQCLNDTARITFGFSSFKLMLQNRYLVVG